MSCVGKNMTDKRSIDQLSFLWRFSCFTCRRRPLCWQPAAGRGCTGRGTPGCGTAPAGWTERWGAAQLTCTPPPRSTRHSPPGSHDSTGPTLCMDYTGEGRCLGEGEHTLLYLFLSETRFAHLKPSCTLMETSLVVQRGWTCWKSAMFSIWSLVFLQSERSAGWKRSARKHTHI